MVTIEEKNRRKNNNSRSASSCADEGDVNYLKIKTGSTRFEIKISHLLHSRQELTRVTICCARRKVALLLKI